jgi:hypothetical protein
MLALAAFGASLVVVPAFAAMQPVGSVALWPVPTRAGVIYPANLTGDILALTARGNADVVCRTVIATFGDGSAVEIFHGTLAPDDQFKVYMPGGVRNIQRIDFNCLSADRGRAIVTVDANLTGPAFLPLG